MCRGVDAPVLAGVFSRRPDIAVSDWLVVILIVVGLDAGLVVVGTAVHFRTGLVIVVGALSGLLVGGRGRGLRRVVRGRG